MSSSISCRCRFYDRGDIPWSFFTHSRGNQLFFDNSHCLIVCYVRCLDTLYCLSRSPDEFQKYSGEESHEDQDDHRDEES
jgi:hypothetical protein